MAGYGSEQQKRKDALVEIDDSKATKNEHVDEFGNYTGKIRVYKGLDEEGNVVGELPTRVDDDSAEDDTGDEDEEEDAEVAEGDSNIFAVDRVASIVPGEPTPRQEEVYSPEEGYEVVQQSRDGMRRIRVSVNVREVGVGLSTWYNFVHTDRYLVVLGNADNGVGSSMLEFDTRSGSPVELTIVRGEARETVRATYLSEFHADGWIFQVLIRMEEQDVDKQLYVADES